MKNYLALIITFVPLLLLIVVGTYWRVDCSDRKDRS
jgi:hypothetical protein